MRSARQSRTAPQAPLLERCKAGLHTRYNTRTIPEVNTLHAFCYAAAMRKPPTSAVFAVLAPVLGALALAVPSPWSWAAAALAVLAAAGAGLATHVPLFLVGRPLVSAPLAGALASLAAYLVDAAFTAPPGWTQAAFLAGAVVCAGVAGVPVPSPRSARAAPLLLLLAALPAHAGAPRYHTHTFTVSTAACPTGAPGLDTDGTAYGISLAAVRAWTVEICPVTAGAYFTGAGLLKTCTYSQTEWGSGSWALGPTLDIGPDGDPTTTDVTTTADNPCRRYWDVEVGVGLSDRVYVYPSTDLGLSAGTQVRVRLFGETR